MLPSCRQAAAKLPNLPPPPRCPSHRHHQAFTAALLLRCRCILRTATALPVLPPPLPSLCFQHQPATTLNAAATALPPPLLPSCHSHHHCLYFIIILASVAAGELLLIRVPRCSCASCRSAAADDTEFLPMPPRGCGHCQCCVLVKLPPPLPVLHVLHTVT